MDPEKGGRVPAVLILDLRGNTGGSDAFGSMFAKMMCDCGALNDEVSFYRNSTANNNALKKLCRTFPGTHMDRVLAETASAEEGSLINWQTILKGADNFTPLVRKGAIIIDNNSASAGESPVRFVRNHSKSHAKVYGAPWDVSSQETATTSSSPTAIST